MGDRFKEEIGTMAVGKVKWFNNAKGFGFIESEDGTEVFVHYSSILEKGFKKLAEGQDVEFEVYDGQKGFHALNVKVLDHFA